jgi:hypothetical protein
LPAELGQALAVAVLDAGHGAGVEPPAGLLKAPAEVGVLGGAEPLVEASQLLEGGAADQEVGGGGAWAVGVGEVGFMVQEAPGRPVASGEGARVGGGDHAAREGADAGVHRRGEVGVEETGERAAVRVEKEDPLIAGAGGAGVASVGR